MIIYRREWVRGRRGWGGRTRITSIFFRRGLRGFHGLKAALYMIKK